MKCCSAGVSCPAPSYIRYRIDLKKTSRDSMFFPYHRRRMWRYHFLVADEDLMDELKRDASGVFRASSPQPRLVPGSPNETAVACGDRRERDEGEVRFRCNRPAFGAL